MKLTPVLLIVFVLLGFAEVSDPVWGDVFQQTWVDPADPSQGMFESDVPGPDGFGRDTLLGVDSSTLDLAQAYLPFQLAVGME